MNRGVSGSGHGQRRQEATKTCAKPRGALVSAARVDLIEVPSEMNIRISAKGRQIVERGADEIPSILISFTRQTHSR